MTDLGDNEWIADGGRRLRGLRGLCGFSTPDDAVSELRLEEVGLTMSGSTWGDIEQPARPRRLKVSEARAIARAVPLHFSFFTAPLERLGDVHASPPTEGA